VIVVLCATEGDLRATTRIRYRTGKCTGVTKKERNRKNEMGRRQKEKKKRG
jgi:hypothetical protein